MNHKEQLKNKILCLWKKSNKERTIAVRGTSMKPLIKEGNRITFRPSVNADKIKTGDIVVFKGQSSLIAHRIVEKIVKGGKIWFKEKGDNNFYPSVIPEDVIVGKVVKIRKKNFSINLVKWYWSFTNRLLGYYWKVLFEILELMMKNKNNIFYKKLKVSSVRKKKLLHFLIGLPVRFFRSKNL